MRSKLGFHVIKLAFSLFRLVLQLGLENRGGFGGAVPPRVLSNVFTPFRSLPGVPRIGSPGIIL